MKPASQIEMTILNGIWTAFPNMPHVCPNCLVSRTGNIGDQPHASWCAIWRDIKAEEAEEASYLICI